MNTWFNNSLIEELRNEKEQDKNVIKNIFIGTIDINSKIPLPKLFEPEVVDFNQIEKILKCNVFIINLNCCNFYEIENLLDELQNSEFTTTKQIILISHQLTWFNSKRKYFPTHIEDEYDIDPNYDFEKDKKEQEEELKIIRKLKMERLAKQKEEEDLLLQKENNEKNNEEILKSTLSPTNKKEIKPKKVKLKKEFNLSEEAKRNKYYYFNNNDYHLRIPIVKYKRFVELENKCFKLSNINHNILTYVICPGYIYGYGEDEFLDYFNKCWYSNDLEIFFNENSFVNTIHIKDLTKVIKNVVEIKPIEKYIFAFDKTREKSNIALFKSISKAIGNGIVIDNKDNLTIEFQCCLRGSLPKTIFNNNFNWHCEFGIAANLSKIRDEFKLYRNYKALKILVIGGPGIGKSTISNCLSQVLNLPILTIKDIFENAISDNYSSQENNKIRERVKNEYCELVNKKYNELMVEYDKSKKKNQEPPNKDNIKVEINDILMAKLVGNKLYENKFMNIGYIIDGYPRNRSDCRFTFFKTNEDEEIKIKKAKEQEEMALLNKKNKIQPKKKDDITPEDYVEDYYDCMINEDIIPNFIVNLSHLELDDIRLRYTQNGDTWIKSKDFKERDENYNKRLFKYKQWNGITTEDKYGISVLKLMKKYRVPIINVNVNSSVEQQIQQILKETGNVNLNTNKSLNKDKNDEKLIKNEIKYFDTENQEKESLEQEFNDLINDSINQIMNTQTNSFKFDDFKDREIKILEKRTQMIRRYLNEEIMPEIANGIESIIKNDDFPLIDFTEELYNYLNSVKSKYD